ncbi:hypothetical protein C0993_009670 [Termitomyces sp. T159_Od127]|nr:hypothetical protein C0993_009670 [Termitomyces sp. T159_Od127]
MQLSVNLSHIETIEPIHLRPNYKPALTHHIEDDKESALAAAEETFAAIPVAIYCNDSSVEDEVSALAVLYIRGHETKTLCYHLRPPLQHTVYEAKVIGFILTLYLLTCLGCSLLALTIIGSDSQAAIQVLLNQHPHLDHYLLDKVHTTAKLLHAKQDQLIHVHDRTLAACRGARWKD